MRESDKGRRASLKKMGLAAAGLVLGTTAVNLAVERHRVQITRPRVRIRGLPQSFEGLRICHITDVHHGPFLALEHVHDAVSLALEQNADLVVLTGDLSHKREWSVAPVWDAMAPLDAPLGVYGVMGNHDWWHGIRASRQGAQHAGIEMIDNRAVSLQRNGERIWLAGVGDMWADRPDLEGALGDVPRDEPVILLTHNPDFADEMHDPRVGLMLAGHSHGGQISLPVIGPPTVPCRREYTAGLVRTDVSQIYISRGIGMAAVPLRFNCRPELPVFELTRA